MLADGDGVEKDPSKAAKLFSLASTQGMVPAMQRLGSAYLEGAGIPKDSEKGRELLMRAAGQKDIIAMATLGRIYEKGDGVSIDYTQAVRWYHLAADHNHLEANYKLYTLVRMGLGGEQYNTTFLTFLKFAADHGLPRAQSDYGLCLMWGVGGAAQDPMKAFDYYEKAAEQGCAGGFAGLEQWFAFHKLRGMSEPEQHGKEDEYHKKTLSALRKDAESGDPGAELAYGQALQRDNQPDWNLWISKGVEKLEKYSQQGDACSSVSLAYFFRDGPPQWKDRQKANKYLEKASTQGCNMPADDLELFRKD
jgi:hypothetical protein